MSDRHLTDDEIQSYLDNDSLIDLRGIEQHLKTCEKCRIELAGYQQLYSGLNEDAGFNLSHDFVQTVISKTIKPELDESRGFYKDLVLGLIGVLSGLGILLYFTGFKPLPGFIAGIQQKQISLIKSIFNDFFVLISDLKLDAHLLLYITMVLVVIAALDYIISRKKKIGFHII